MKKTKETLIIQTRVEPELALDLKKILEIEGQERNVSQVIRSLVKDFVRAGKKEPKIKE